MKQDLKFGTFSINTEMGKNNLLFSLFEKTNVSKRCLPKYFDQIKQNLPFPLSSIT